MGTTNELHGRVVDDDAASNVTSNFMKLMSLFKSACVGWVLELGL
jgi:hypothetical protein